MVNFFLFCMDLSSFDIPCIMRAFDFYDIELFFKEGSFLAYRLVGFPTFFSLVLFASFYNSYLVAILSIVSISPIASDATKAITLGSHLAYNAFSLGS